jgi:hypothetical protein
VVAKRLEALSRVKHLVDLFVFKAIIGIFVLGLEWSLFFKMGILLREKKSIRVRKLNILALLDVYFLFPAFELHFCLEFINKPIESVLSYGSFVG